MSFGFNWFYAVIAVLFAGMLYINSKYFKGSSGLVVGITHAKEYKITAERSSLVKAVYVVPGKQVKQNDLLIELSSTELDIEISKLNNRIAILRSELQDQQKLLNSEIAYVRAQYAVEIAELEGDIADIRSELKLNQAIGNAVNSPGIEDSLRNPSVQRIAYLEKQKKSLEQALSIRVEDLRKEGETDQNQRENQVGLLVQELNLLAEEKKKLAKFAPSDGVVENVFVKDGEQVEAYSSLLSVDPLRPTTVVGYLSGRAVPLLIGDTVTIAAYAKAAPDVSGRVIGFGAVAALPDILQKSTAERAFGQEIFIEIPPENPYAIGEKVLIKRR